MIIKIKDPDTCNELAILATQEKIKEAYIWRIIFPKNETIFISQLNGQWKAIGKLIISHDLLNEIGINLHPLAILNTLNRKCFGTAVLKTTTP